MIRIGLIFLACAGLLSVGVVARGDGPTTKPDTATGTTGLATSNPGTVASEDTGGPAEPARVERTKPIVVGFVGGFLRRDDAVHSTVILARNLQKAYGGMVSVQTFENRRVSEARNWVLRLLAQGGPNGPMMNEERSVPIVLYGHSWGASATVALARALNADGIPVRLTVQVDSVAKFGSDDSVIPENVQRAANFFQDNGFPRGQQHIHAADASRTHIIGNFKFDYTAKPISCPEYPWLARVFMKPHIEIECDPVVWHRVEELIRAELPPTARSGLSVSAGSQ